MKEVTREMIRLFKIKKLGFDFMGYEVRTVAHKSDLSFHHLLVSSKDCQELGLGSGYLLWNGAILRQSCSHEYLHVIEKTDREIFDRITLEMKIQNEKEHLDLENILKIHDMLYYFEKEHHNDTVSHGKNKLIKYDYVLQRKKF